MSLLRCPNTQHGSRQNVRFFVFGVVVQEGVVHGALSIVREYTRQ